MTQGLMKAMKAMKVMKVMKVMKAQAMQKRDTPADLSGRLCHSVHHLTRVDAR